MTDNNTGSSQVDTSVHQSEYELKQSDALDIALLANVVGKELTQVDKFAVNGLQKATRIDQQKIFNKQPISSAPHVPETSQTKQQPQEQKPLPIPVSPEPVKHIQPSLDNNELIKYLKSFETRLERIENLYQSILDNITDNSNKVTITLSKNAKD